MDFNKTLIIEQIKKHLGLSKDKEFADYLGVKPNVVANWKKRNSYDAELIFTKCDFLNAEILLTGKGELIKTKYTEKHTLLKSKEKGKENGNKQNIQKNLPLEEDTEKSLIEVITEKIFDNIYTKLKNKGVIREISLLNDIESKMENQGETLKTLEAIIGLNILSNKLIVSEEDEDTKSIDQKSKNNSQYKS